MRIVERKEVGQALKAFCDKYDTYAEAAKKLGITPSQLSSALNKPKSVVPAKALKKLGFKFEAVYLGKDPEPTRLQKVVKSLSTKPPAAARNPDPRLRVRAPVKKPAKSKPAPPMRDIAGGMVADVQPFVESVPPVEESENRNAVDNSVIESVVDVEPDNQDIYVPDDQGNNTPIFPEPEAEEPEPMFDENGYPIYN